MSELTEIRRTVAELELSKIIEYKNHRDHTAHTLNLFLLGIWLYDNAPLIRETFTSKLESMNKTKYNERYISEIFLLQWTFASLLHDIGYIFSELNDKTISYRNKIDELFGFAWFESHMLKSNFETNKIQKQLFNIHNNFKKSYGSKLVHKTANTNNPIEILNILAYMPGIKELGFENLGVDIFQVFNTSTRSANFLKSFAYNVAKDGYDGNGIGTVDHAVASGLFLLQYSTYWYWLVTTCKEKKDVFPDWASYSIDNVRFIVEACRAVAYHNITFDGQQKKFDIHEDPVLYLGILCDEICTWKRFPASNNISEVWNKHNFLESTDINLSHYPDLLGGEVQFEIINKSFDLSRIINSLDMKLKNWKKIVNIKKL